MNVLSPVLLCRYQRIKTLKQITQQISHYYQYLYIKRKTLWKGLLAVMKQQNVTWLCTSTEHYSIFQLCFVSLSVFSFQAAVFNGNALNTHCVLPSKHHMTLRRSACEHSVAFHSLKATYSSQELVENSERLTCICQVARDTTPHEC